LQREHRKYIREEEILRDKQQLTIDTLKPMNNLLKPRLNLNVEQLVICPFCLYQAKLRYFLLSVKKGFHKSLGICPECEQRALFETLLTIPNFSPKQFAEWVYNYGREFWKKCIFKKFRNRLYLDKEYAQIFWFEYKRLKGESD